MSTWRPAAEIDEGEGRLFQIAVEMRRQRGDLHRHRNRASRREILPRAPALGNCLVIDRHQHQLGQTALQLGISALRGGVGRGDEKRDRLDATLACIVDKADLGHHREELLKGGRREIHHFRRTVGQDQPVEQRHLAR